MPKNKSHKGLLKRIRISKTGKVRHKHASSGHLKSSKTAKRLRKLRKGKFFSNAEGGRLQKLLHRRVRGRDQPRASLRRNPSPEERRASQAAKRELAAKAEQASASE